MGILTKHFSHLNSNPIITYNTGTLYDVGMGEYIYDENGLCYLNAGLSTTMSGFVGAGQTYKSTVALSLAMSMLGIYPDSDCIILDAENTLSEQRCHAVSHHPEFPIDGRVVISGSEGKNVAEIWGIIEDIAKAKEKNKKDCTVEMPFIDPATGKKKQAWIPTVVIVDTISELKAKVTKDMVEEKGLDDKKIKTIYMADGNQKTVFNNLLSTYAVKYGIVVICCAHTGKNIEMDSYTPPKKQLQYFQQDERLKNVGSNFDRLTRTLTRTKAKTLYDGSKECYYPDGPTHANDINEVSAQIIRNKSGMGSGCIMPLIVSQQEGLLSTLTYYHLLKQYNKYGLEGGNVHKPVLKSDASISRNNARSLFNSDYALRRAIEITGQICWIGTHWNTSKMPWDFSNSGKNILDAIVNSKDPQLKDILESRGWWTYGKCDRPYMALPDILNKVIPIKK